MWGMKVELVMKVEWVKKVVWGMKVSLVMKVEGVVTLVWHGDERVHAEQEVQHHAFVLHVCKCTVRHQREKPPPNEAPNIT